MLDERTKMMLEAANALTAEDLDYLRSNAPVVKTSEEGKARGVAAPKVMKQPPQPKQGAASTHSRGEHERQRTRESKVSTACVGHERAKHEWWPVGTELVGFIGPETFTARVVENLQVKSGRSLLISSGAAQGSVCITPTRAAIEATEAYRQANNLGRGGGVTNGWLFWKPKSDG